MKVKKLTLLALYTTIALTIYTVESAIPSLVPISGVKLGLANVVTLWLLMHTSKRDALLVLLVRILLASIFAGQMISFSYSLCGGLLCFLCMSLLFWLLGKRAVVFISIMGALAHNLGQILVAIVLLQSLSILAYLPILTISAIVTGTFTGLCVYFASKKLPPSIAWPMK